MKKIGIIMLILGLVIAMAACADPNEIAKVQNNLELAGQYYSATSDSTKIEQTVTVKKGSMVQYERTRTMTLNGANYDVTETEKTLNTIDADEAYTTTNSAPYTITKQEGTQKLSFNEEYFATGYTFDETSGLKATVKKGSIKSFLGITGEIAEPTSDMTIDMTITSGKVSSVTLTYNTSENTVTIHTAFTY